MATPFRKDMPQWERTLLAKHEQFMFEHQTHFGVLGQPQTKQQKQRLKQANRELTKSGARS